MSARTGCGKFCSPWMAATVAREKARFSAAEDVRQPAQEGEIGAGLEMPPVAAQHDEAKVALAAEPLERSSEAVDDSVVIGVVDLGPVEPDRRDAAAVGFDENDVLDMSARFLGLRIFRRTGIHFA